MPLLSDRNRNVSIHLPNNLKELVNKKATQRIRSLFGPYARLSFSHYVQYLIINDLGSNGLISDEDTTALTEEQLRLLK